MKTKKIIALLFLIATIVIHGQLVAFAAEPPGVDSPFGDTGDDTSPPALEGGAADDDDDIADDADAADDSADDSADDADTADVDTDADSAAVAGAQDDTPGGGNIISESGPGVAFLLIPSLILGYAYRRKKKTSK